MNKMKPTNYKPFFKAQVQGDTLEMLVYDSIGQTWDGSGVTAKGIKQQIDDAGKFKNISLRINSPGGDVFEGVAICNLLRSLRTPINVSIDGVAASSASIIAMAGDTITMGSNSIIMIHNAWTMCMGEAKDMRKMADTLDIITNSIAQTYVDRTGKPMAEVKEMMNAETWLNATDAIANGFATQLSEKPEEQSGPALALAKTFDYKAYTKTPAALKNESEDVGKACQCECTSCTNGTCSDCSMEGCKDNNCIDCPMQNVPADSNLSTYEARLALLKLAK